MSFDDYQCGQSHYGKPHVPPSGIISKFGRIILHFFEKGKERHRNRQLQASQFYSHPKSRVLTLVGDLKIEIFSNGLTVGHRAS